MAGLDKSGVCNVGINTVQQGCSDSQHHQACSSPRGVSHVRTTTVNSRDQTLWYLIVNLSLYLSFPCSSHIDREKHGDCSVHQLAPVSAVQSSCSHVLTHWLHPACGEARVWLLCGDQHDHLHGILLLEGVYVLCGEGTDCHWFLQVGKRTWKCCHTGREIT